MKTVNLLPQWYLDHQRQGRQLRVRLALMVLLAATLFGWSAFERARVRLLREQRDQLVHGTGIIPDLSTQLQRTQEKIQHLESLKLAYRDLGNTVHMSNVIQQIQNNMTPGMALSRTTIEVHAEPIKSKDAEPDPATPRLHDVAHITVVGIAPNDVLIAQLIGKLSANPLFTDLSLNYTRTEIIHDFNVRRFEIQMTIDLDRVPTEDPTPTRLQATLPETAHAG